MVLIRRLIWFCLNEVLTSRQEAGGLYYRVFLSARVFFFKRSQHHLEKLCLAKSDTFQYVSMIFNDLQWSLMIFKMNFNDLQWSSMIFNDLQWASMVFNDHSILLCWLIFVRNKCPRNVQLSAPFRQMSTNLERHPGTRVICTCPQNVRQLRETH